MGLDDQQIYSTFTYKCRSSVDYLIDYNLVLGVFGQVNQVSGPFTIQILECSGTTSDSKTFTSKVGAFTLSKYLPEFYLHTFVAVTQSNQTVPATDFASGADIKFKWESNGTYFQLFMKDLGTPIYADKENFFTLKGDVNRDTTFFLVASVTGKPDSDSSGAGYEPIYLYDSLSITVSDPIIDETLTVKGKLSALSELSVKGVDFAALVQKVNDQAGQIQQLQKRPIPIFGTGTANSGTPGWTLASLPNGPGDRTFSQRVNFPSPLAHTPIVTVSLMGVDCQTGVNTRVKLTVSGVTNAHFDVIMEAWWDSIVWGIWYNWIAI